MKIMSLKSTAGMDTDIQVQNPLSVIRFVRYHSIRQMLLRSLVKRSFSWVNSFTRAEKDLIVSDEKMYGYNSDSGIRVALPYFALTG